MSLDRFQPLLNLPGLQWYSLQVGRAADELAAPRLPAESRIWGGVLLTLVTPPG